MVVPVGITRLKIAVGVTVQLVAVKFPPCVRATLRVYDYFFQLFRKPFDSVVNAVGTFFRSSYPDSVCSVIRNGFGLGAVAGYFGVIFVFPLYKRG